MNKILLYVGANNTTKVVEVSKMQKVLDKYFMGYTIIACNGRYNGVNEQAVKVEIFDDKQTFDSIKEIIKSLRIALAQDVILTDINNQVLFI